ncbi:hypothetical protein CHUAL_004025 [Chamberlinius hualienensis]
MALAKDQLSAEELKSKLFTKMNDEGKFDFLRASMRSEVIKCFYSDKKSGRLPIDLAADHSTEIQLEVLNWLVEEHLRRNHYEFTRSIFNLEAKNVHRSRLNIVEVLNHLGIELSNDVGRNIITSHANANDGLFLWNLLTSSLNVSESVQKFKSDDKCETKNGNLLENKDENDIINSLHRRLKQIDDFYNERKLLANFPESTIKLSSSENRWTRNAQEVVKINYYKESDLKNTDIPSETDWESRKQSQKLELDSERKKLEKLKDELETRERQLNLQQENYQKEILSFEKKCRDMESRYLHSNALQQRLENREKHLEIRERQHFQLISNYKKLKAELNNGGNYGSGKDYLSPIREEYEGKLSDAQTKIRFLQNKIHMVEEMIEHERLKHQQQCTFYDEQLRLQRDRIRYLHKAIEEMQMPSVKHQLHASLDPFYLSSFARFAGHGDSILAGVDLQETYFDTSLNASQIAPELELGKHLNDTMMDMKALDLRGIRARLRELENEAEEMEYNYSKLDKSDKRFSDEASGIKYDVPETSITVKYETERKNSTEKQIVKGDTKELRHNLKIDDLEAKEMSLPSQDQLKQNVIQVESAEKCGNLEETVLNVTFTLPETLDFDIPNNADQFEEKLLESVSSAGKEKASEDHHDDSVRSESLTRFTPRSSTPVEGSKIGLELDKSDYKDESEKQSDDIPKDEQPISWEKVSGDSDNDFEW